MSDLLADISTWSILKWVILVLIAGFIGQFGKNAGRNHRGADSPAARG